MSLIGKLKRLSDLLGLLGRPSGIGIHDIGNLVERAYGARLAGQWQTHANGRGRIASATARGEKLLGRNPLSKYLAGVEEGRGIHKWLHYPDVYHRHLEKFINSEVTVVEIGVHSGGSLPMWRHYFGEGCHVHGIDIHNECKIYEDSHTTVHIGDQADRTFWRRFRDSVPVVDVLIDDGGHKPQQQIVTMEEMLPHLQPGGIYICEDIHGIGNQFSAYVHSLADGLNAYMNIGTWQELKSVSTAFQDAVHSVHLYPFMVVIERRDAVVQSFVAPTRGTEWQPFF